MPAQKMFGRISLWGVPHFKKVIYVNYYIHLICITSFSAYANLCKECVAVLTMLYKKNGAVTGVGSDFLSDWALHLARTWLVVTQFARNEK